LPFCVEPLLLPPAPLSGSFDDVFGSSSAVAQAQVTNTVLATTTGFAEGRISASP
jgi:hypothetical protein